MGLDKKNNFEKDNNGMALLMTMVVMSFLMFLSSFFLSFSVSERTIAKSQATGVRSYYLAESGINEMIWLIKNDDTYKTNFETLAGWATTTQRNNPFGPGSGVYSVTINNTSAAHGEIVSTGGYSFGNNNAQRVVKTYVYKATGITTALDKGGYADGNIDISSSEVNFFNGAAHSNNNFIVNNSAVIYVDTDLEAVGNYLAHVSVTDTILGDIYAANYPPAATEVVMPAVDFNSSSSDSWLNRADNVYTQQEFEDLMEANQNLVLNGITYVTGDVELQGAQTITMSGILVVEGDFIVGFKKKWKGREGDSNLHINHATGTPSGVLASRHVDFKEFTGIVKVNGVIYANDLMNLTNISASPNNFEVEGGLIARKLTITSCWEPINITHDYGIMVDVLGPASSSPTIIVEHWEEEY